MNKAKSMLFISILVMLSSLALVATSTYAWFLSLRVVGDKIIEPGQLDSHLEIEYWTDGQWEVLDGAGITAELYPHFGGLTDLSSVPEDADVYFKIKVVDESDARYKYDIRISSIVINVYKVLNTSIQQLQSSDFIEPLDYYNVNEKFMCFDNKIALSTNSNSNPTSLSYGSNVKLHSPNQSITSGATVLDTNWVYLKLSLKETELLDIIKRIPADKMPYSIEFMISIKGETFTQD